MVGSEHVRGQLSSIRHDAPQPASRHPIWRHCSAKSASARSRCRTEPVTQLAALTSTADRQSDAVAASRRVGDLAAVELSARIRESQGRAPVRVGAPEERCSSGWASHDERDCAEESGGLLMVEDADGSLPPISPALERLAEKMRTSSFSRRRTEQAAQQAVARMGGVMGGVDEDESLQMLHALDLAI